jgi:mannose-6-phosphate isomerase-like protein (cupin superfamily)
MSQEKTVGGLILRSVAAGRGVVMLGHDPYEYRAVFRNDGAPVELSGADMWCFHLYSKGSAPVEVSVSDRRLRQDETLWISKKDKVRIDWMAGDGMLLVGSRTVGQVGDTEFRHFTGEAVKKVQKPWGYELWLTGDPSPHFAFKRIFIKAGTKTSLQYHEKKRETNFLIEGEANLHFNPDPAVAARDFQPANVSVETIGPGTVVDVQPLRVHRLEAVTDILLCEVSTPELDDVIRITDDSGRRDGRLESEHKV